MKPVMEHYCKEVQKGSFSVSHIASALAKNALLYVQYAGNFIVRPPYFTERKNLPSFLLILTVRGEGRITTGRGTEITRAGTCAFLNCTEYHRYEPAGQDDWDFLWLHFSGGSALGYCQEYSKGGKSAVRLQDPEHFYAVFREIISLQAEKSIAAELNVNRHITELLTVLLACSCRIDSAESALPDYIRTVIRSMERSCGTRVTLDQLAAQANISKYHLSREFKARTGVNLSAYLLQLRMNRARELLIFTDQTVGEIALACGFNDASHFIRVFKSQEGDTPLACREQWQNRKENLF